MVLLQTFSSLRYAQCWEDADVLLEGLDIQSHDVCLSIASAGDNTLAMLARNPKKVIAIDLNPTQIACLDLRVSAYQHLSYQELLEFMGSRPSHQRLALYKKCRDFVRLESTKTFWDAHIENFERYGIGGIGKFENYFRLFQNWILPLIASKKTIQRFFSKQTEQQRITHYQENWNTKRWRSLIAFFCSPRVMGALGRDPSFFTYVTDSVPEHILKRVEYALTTLDSSENPY